MLKVLNKKRCCVFLLNYLTTFFHRILLHYEDKLGVQCLKTHHCMVPNICCSRFYYGPQNCNEPKRAVGGVKVK